MGLSLDAAETLSLGIAGAIADPRLCAGHFRLAAISREKSQHPFQHNTDRKPGGNIAHPMRKQHHPGCDQARADAPDEIALSGRKPAGRGSERADMDGMAGRKRVLAPAGERNAAPVSSDGQAIRTFLIE